MLNDFTFLLFYLFTFFLTFAAANINKKSDMTNNRWTNIILSVVALLLAALCVVSIMKG